MLFRVYTNILGKKHFIYSEDANWVNTHQWHKSWLQRGTVTTVLPTVANKTAENWFSDEQLQRSPHCSQVCRPKSHASTIWMSPVSCSASLLYIFQSSSCSVHEWIYVTVAVGTFGWFILVRGGWREYNRKDYVLCPPSVTIFYVPWVHWSKV